MVLKKSKRGASTGNTQRKLPVAKLWRKEESYITKTIHPTPQVQRISAPGSKCQKSGMIYDGGMPNFGDRQSFLLPVKFSLHKKKRWQLVDEVEEKIETTEFGEESETGCRKGSRVKKKKTKQKSKKLNKRESVDEPIRTVVITRVSASDSSVCSGVYDTGNKERPIVKSKKWRSHVKSFLKTDETVDVKYEIYDGQASQTWPLFIDSSRSRSFAKTNKAWNGQELRNSNRSTKAQRLDMKLFDDFRHGYFKYEDYSENHPNGDENAEYDSANDRCEFLYDSKVFQDEYEKSANNSVDEYDYESGYISDMSIQDLDETFADEESSNKGTQSNGFQLGDYLVKNDTKKNTVSQIEKRKQDLIGPCNPASSEVVQFCPKNSLIFIDEEEFIQNHSDTSHHQAENSEQRNTAEPTFTVSDIGANLENTPQSLLPKQPIKSLASCERLAVSVSTDSISAEKLKQIDGCIYVEGKSSPRTFALLLGMGQSQRKGFLVAEELSTKKTNITSLNLKIFRFEKSLSGLLQDLSLDESDVLSFQDIVASIQREFNASRHRKINRPTKHLKSPKLVNRLSKWRAESLDEEEVFEMVFENMFTNLVSVAENDNNEIHSNSNDVSSNINNNRIASVNSNKENKRNQINIDRSDNNNDGITNCTTVHSNNNNNNKNGERSNNSNINSDEHLNLDDFELVSNDSDLCNICYDVMFTIPNEQNMQLPDMLQQYESIACEVILLKPCLHSFCKHCWEEYISGKILCNNTNIICPSYKCGTNVDFVTICAIVSPELAARYVKVLFESTVQRNSEYQWCPTCERPAHCSGFRADGRDSCLRDIPTVTCSCKEEFCFSCQEEPHWPASCENVQRKKEAIEKVIEFYYDKNGDMFSTEVEFKKCPFCRVSINKNQGCNHMLCICGKSFCWRCLKPFGRNHDFDCKEVSAEVKTFSSLDVLWENRKSSFSRKVIHYSGLVEAVKKTRTKFGLDKKTKFELDKRPNEIKSKSKQVVLKNALVFQRDVCQILNNVAVTMFVTKSGRGQVSRNLSRRVMAFFDKMDFLLKRLTDITDHRNVADVNFGELNKFVKKAEETVVELNRFLV